MQAADEVHADPDVGAVHIGWHRLLMGQFSLAPWRRGKELPNDDVGVVVYLGDELVARQDTRRSDDGRSVVDGQRECVRLDCIEVNQDSRPSVVLGVREDLKRLVFGSDSLLRVFSLGLAKEEGNAASATFRAGNVDVVAPFLVGPLSVDGPDELLVFRHSSPQKRLFRPKEHLRIDLLIRHEDREHELIRVRRRKNLEIGGH